MLRELSGLILIYGGVVQLTGMWIAQDKLGFTTGLWLGIALAVFMAWHMNRSIIQAVEYDEKGALNYMRKTYALRTIVICGVVVATYFLSLGNVVATFIGLMGLKAAAYLQPVVHKHFQK